MGIHHLHHSRVPAHRRIGGADVTDIELIIHSMSRVGKTALVRHVYGGDPITGAIRAGLENRGLIDPHGEATQLGRHVADHLTTH